MHKRWILVLILAAAMAIGFNGCSERAETPPPSVEATQRYELRGTILSVDTAGKKAVIDHEKIADLMDAMSMSFSVPDAADLAKLQPGKIVEATLVVEHNAMWMESVKVVGDAPIPVEPATPHAH